MVLLFAFFDVLQQVFQYDEWDVELLCPGCVVVVLDVLQYLAWQRSGHYYAVRIVGHSIVGIAAQIAYLLAQLGMGFGNAWVDKYLASVKFGHAVKNQGRGKALALVS